MSLRSSAFISGFNFGSIRGSILDGTICVDGLTSCRSEVWRVLSAKKGFFSERTN